MTQEEIKAKAEASLEEYEIYDSVGCICYVDGYEEGYTQALIDNPILQDIKEGKVLIVDKGWSEQHDKQMIDNASFAFCVASRCINRVNTSCRKNCKKLEEFKSMILED